MREPSHRSRVGTAIAELIQGRIRRRWMLPRGEEGLGVNAGQSSIRIWSRSW